MAGSLRALRAGRAVRIGIDGDDDETGLVQPRDP